MSHTNRKRAAKKIAAEQGITYMQALSIVLAAENVPASVPSGRPTCPNCDSDEWDFVENATARCECGYTWSVDLDDEDPVCVTCGHAAAHNTGGLGICDTDECGCDGPTTGEPNKGFLLRKAEIANHDAVRKHLPEFVTVTAVYDYSTVTVTVDFPSFDLADWEHGAADVQELEDAVGDILTGEGHGTDYNDLVIDGDTLEDALQDMMFDAVVVAGREHAPLTYTAAELLYGKGGAGDVIAYADSITAFPIEWGFCGACDREMPLDPNDVDTCLTCGSPAVAGSHDPGDE